MKLSKWQKAFTEAYLTNGGHATETAGVAGYQPHKIVANAAKT